MAKSKEKVIARGLRLKGESIGEIAKTVGAGKSTVSLWCQDILLSDLQNKKLLERSIQASEKGRLVASENRKKERISRENMFRSVGINKIGNLTKRDLFLIGIALYWAEGGKNQRRATFINSDPSMIIIFVKWVTSCLGVSIDRLICRIEINEIHSHRLRQIENYWSKITKIPLTQFRKASLKHVKNQKIYQSYDDYFGSLQITLSRGTNLSYEILGYIQGLSLLSGISNDKIGG